ncbi:glycosyltransferase [Acinetobacter sp. PFS20]|uniref:glycosyltransferase n=1 Tax=Acinetobacter sp. PFS20 TaxID=3458434 RepID=UPI003FD6BB74
MKILMLAPYSSPIVQRLSKALEKYSECEVWVASFNVETDLEKKVISLGEINSFIDYFKFYKVNKLVKKLNPDIVHAHIINHYGIMAIFQKKPLIVGLWGSDVMLAPNKGSFLKREIFKLINAIVIKRANLMHTSSNHILEELIKKHGKYIKNKTNVFYWGFPVEEPSHTNYQLIQAMLKKEYNIEKDNHLIVFPRGLSKVYDPDNVVKVIKKLLNIKELKIVVLRGFSSEEDVKNFKDKLGAEGDKIIFINRLLNTNELYVLYSQTKYHVSIPISDALGGGVIEPFLRGSFPILSNIKPYKNFVEQNSGFILEDYSEFGLNNLENKILNDQLKVGGLALKNTDYSAQAIVEKFKKLYEIVLK